MGKGGNVGDGKILAGELRVQGLRRQARGIGQGDLFEFQFGLGRKYLRLDGLRTSRRLVGIGNRRIPTRNRSCASASARSNAACCSRNTRNDSSAEGEVEIPLRRAQHQGLLCRLPLEVGKVRRKRKLAALRQALAAEQRLAR